MITNIDNLDVKDKVESETNSNPAVKAIYEHIASVPESYSIDIFSAGLEFIPENKINNQPNRCRLKIWQPSPNQLLAFFFKRSSVPHSRDRFSYGGVAWDLNNKDLSNISSEIDAWLEWLHSGLNPDKRPPNWVSAFHFDIPD